LRAFPAPDGGGPAQEMNKEAMEKPRILIVDDNHMMTDMWRMLFERVARFEVGIENSAADVLETARLFRPGLIFMDFCLTGKNGVEIAAELEADPVLKFTPIVFLTGLSKEEAAERRLSDRHMVLTKPVDLREILACAERFFSIPKLEAA
jgi:CheY-like chemotaxis protein